MDLIQSMRFPSFWEFKRRFLSRVLKVPSDIVKSEFMLEPGIITCGINKGIITGYPKIVFRYKDTIVV